MTRQSAKRRVTGIVLAALAIGISAPAAGARPFDLTGADAVAPVHVQRRRLRASRRPAATPPAETSPTSDTWRSAPVPRRSAVGVGGTLAATRRHQRRRTGAQSTITA